MTKEVQNAVTYYYCDVCHYCFEAKSLPDRCPQTAAKRTIRTGLPSARQPKKKYRIFCGLGMRNGNKPTDCLLWYPRRAVFISITNYTIVPITSSSSL